MSRNWQKIDFKKDWGGLVDRRQALDYGPAMASIATNVDFFGGTIGKRQGSQYLNGWGAITESGWTQTAGTVNNAAGFQAGDTLTFYFADGTSEAETINNITSGVITLNTALTHAAPEAGIACIARRPLGGGAGDRIDGLFQANFRNGDQHLLAAAEAELYLMDTFGTAGAGGTALTQDFPSTTVAANWADTLTGTLTSVEGLEAGDKIVIAGRMGALKYVTVSSIDNLVTGQITLVSPGADSAPQASDVVTFFPTRTGGDIHFAQHNNICHMATDHAVVGVGTAGDDPPLKYSNPGGGYVTQRHGIKAPTHSGTAPTATAGAAGNLTGTFIYRLKFRNSVTGHSSEPGPSITSAALTSKQCDLNNLPVSVDPQVDYKDLYRTTSDGNGVWYFVAALTNAATSYPDDTADSGLGSQMREFLDNPIPDAVSNIAVWPQANRLIGVNASTGAVVFSDQPDLEDGTLKPEAWPVDNFLFINFDDGDKTIAVVPFYDSVIVFKERSIFRIEGIPPNISIEPVSFRQDFTSLGTFNAKAVVVDQNEMLFPTRDGVASLNRFGGQQKGFTSQRISRQIDEGWADLNLTQARKTHAVFVRNRRQLRIFIPVSSDTEPEQCYVYQLEGGIDGMPYGWSDWDINGGVADDLEVSASCVIKSEPDVHYIGTATGDVIRMDYGYAERGGFSITFKYAPAWAAPAGNGSPARARALDVAIAIQLAATLQVSVETDFGAGQYPIQMAGADQGGFQLDVSQLDVHGMSGGYGMTRLSTTLLALGEYHRPVFEEYSNTANFLIQNWTYWFQALPEQCKPRAFAQSRS